MEQPVLSVIGRPTTPPGVPRVGQVGCSTLVDAGALGRRNQGHNHLLAPASWHCDSGNGRPRCSQSRRRISRTHHCISTESRCWCRSCRGAYNRASPWRNYHNTELVRTHGTLGLGRGSPGLANQCNSSCRRCGGLERHDRRRGWPLWSGTPSPHSVPMSSARCVASSDTMASSGVGEASGTT